MAAFEEKQKSEDRIKPGYRWLINKLHFEEALKKVIPSVNEKVKWPGEITQSSVILN